MLLPFLKRERRLPSLVRGGRRNESIKLLGDRVLVRPIVQSKTQGGVLLADAVQSNIQEGEVLAVGRGARRPNGAVTPLDIEVGDRIVFARASGVEITRDGERLLVLREADIFGVQETPMATRRAA